MKTKSTVSTVMTFAAAVVFGSGVAIAIASTAAVSRAAPSLRTTLQTTPQEVTRLAPVVVTISGSSFDRIRGEARSETEVARSNDARKVTRG